MQAQQPEQAAMIMVSKQCSSVGARRASIRRNLEQTMLLWDSCSFFGLGDSCKLWCSLVVLRVNLAKLVPLSMSPFPELPLWEEEGWHGCYFSILKNQCHFCNAVLVWISWQRQTQWVSWYRMATLQSINSPGMSIPPYLGARLVWQLL